jgi:hypothetical protein
MKRLVVAALAVLLFGGAAMAQSPADLTVQGLRLGTGTKAAAATSGAATLSKPSGVITSEALTTAAAGTYVLTLTNTLVAATDIVLASVSMGTSTTGLPDITSVKLAAGSVVITVQNAGVAVFNGTLRIAFVLVKCATC